MVHVSDYGNGNLNMKNRSSEAKDNKVQKVQITDIGLSQSVYLHNDLISQFIVSLLEIKFANVCDLDAL